MASIAAGLALLGGAVRGPEASLAAMTPKKTQRALNTRIISGPVPLTPIGQPVRFAFSSGARARFECRLDRRAWRSCTSPKRYRDLAAGPHRFEVRARRRGSRAAKPARMRFEIVREEAGPGPWEPGVAVGDVGGTSREVGPVSGISVLAPDGVWSTPLPAHTVIDPRSETLVNTLLTSIDRQLRQGILPGLTTRARTPIYEAGPDVARVSVVLDSGPWVDELRSALADGVPIPRGALPSSGSDQMITVWQPSSDAYWEFFSMQQALHPPQFLRHRTVVAEGGSLPAGSYHYRLTAINAHGETTAAPSGLVVNVRPEDSTVQIRWAEIEDATGYRIYREDGDSGPGLLATVARGTDRYVDDGSSLPAGPPPPSAGSAHTPGRWHAITGGKIDAASRSPGYFQDVVSPDGAVRQRYFWGASATSLPLVGGLITRRDLALGRIDHALSIGLPNTSPASSIIAADMWAFPAQRSDGKSTLPTAIPEGTRMRLDPDLDLSSLGLSPFARMLAEAVQRYGMIVHGGSAATAIYGEDPSPYERLGEPSFYEAYLGPQPPRGYAEGFPWEHLQVTEMALCNDQSRSCSPAGQP
jgi:hypothetical protein